MARSKRNARKTRSSSANAGKPESSKATMENPTEEISAIKSIDINTDAQKSSFSTSDVKAKPMNASKIANRRPPLPRGKTAKKRSKKEEEDEREATNLDGDESPLKQRKLLGRAKAAIAIAASSPGRPRRRAVINNKKQYTEIDSSTDDETSSDDESDYGNDKNDKAERALASSGKTNMRKKGANASRKTSNAKMAKAKKSSSQGTTNALKDASPAAKKTRGSPSILSTPKGASIGLTPIKDSVSKVWKNDGVDWRVFGAIDYDLD